MNRILEYYHIDPSTPSPITLPIQRWRGLSKLFRDFGYTVGAEIGVSFGVYSKCLMDHNPKLFMYCVDPWIGVDWRYQRCIERIGHYPCKIIRKTSMEALNDVPELDFVFIDAEHHFDFVMEDIIEWSKKVRKGGIVSGHDYFRYKDITVIEAVDAYVKAHHLTHWFLTAEKDKPTWLWMKDYVR